MDIAVCIKRVPDTADVVKIDASNRDIERDRLAFKLNDWDEYALEAAVQLKEKQGGSITAVTVGPKEWDDVLRRALAMGADRAIRVDEDVVKDDPYIVARILEATVRDLSCDVILFGAQSEDFSSGQLGVMVAELLGIPHASLVVSLEIENSTARVRRELEAGILELYTIKLPALLTVQTGINKPRYISMSGIKRAMSKELQVVSLSELGLPREQLVPGVNLQKLELPPAGKRAEFLSGAPEETAEKLARILQNSGVL
jgi:electron transfer flavoprotein beta subunit